MGWITKEDGQHIYIGSGGEFQPRGPTAATAGGKGTRAERLDRLQAQKKRLTTRDYERGNIERMQQRHETLGKLYPKEATLASKSTQALKAVRAARDEANLAKGQAATTRQTGTTGPRPSTMFGHSAMLGYSAKPAAPSLREQAATAGGVSPHALAGKMPIGKFAAGVNPSEIAKGYGLPHDFYTDARVTERGAGGFPSLRGEVHVSDKYDPKGEVSKAVDARESAQKRGLYEGTRRKFYDQQIATAIGAAAKRASRK